MTKKLKKPNPKPIAEDLPEGNYEVGFKKPPKATRFTKGQSGNPNGRPKGSKNLASIVINEAKQLITVTQDGKTRQVMKIEAAMTQLLNKAAKGDFASLRLLTQVMPSMESQVAKNDRAPLSDEQDRQVLDELLKRFWQAKKSKQSK